jgi:hypothetical protein
MFSVRIFGGSGLQPLLAALSPYRTHHINRFGMYEVHDREPAPVDYGVIFEMVERLAA